MSLALQHLDGRVSLEWKQHESLDEVMNIVQPLMATVYPDDGFLRDNLSKRKSSQTDFLNVTLSSPCFICAMKN